MKKIIKSVFITLIIIVLLIFVFLKNIENKRQIIYTEEIYKEYSYYRDSTKLLIKAYKDSLDNIRSKN